MFRFAHSEYLYFLYLVPVIVFIYWFTKSRQNKLLKSFANIKLHKVLFPKRSSVKSGIKFVSLLFAIILLILALANPQVGSKIEEVKQVGIDVYILLDVSLSMTAEDIKPSRLEKAKFEISKLIRKLQGDRIGLIVFSGQAYVQFPLTTDYSAANLFLSAVDVNSVPQPGTAISSAIELAMKSFKEDDETKKAIVVITDGEDHEGKLKSVVEDAASKGVNIYAIGLGDSSGAPIPIYNSAGMRTDFKKDQKGNVVLTKLDETTLQEVTSIGNGKYYRGTNTSDELDQIYNDLAKIEESEFGATKITEYEDRFHYLIVPVLILLLFELLVSSNKSKFLMSIEKPEL
jgi:Ca-activated chloride channel family protein